MSRYLDKLELWIERAFWNSKKLPNNHVLIPCLTRLILAKELESIEKLECPYCGFKAVKKYSLRSHIIAKHSSDYFSDIKKVMNAYLRLVKVTSKGASTTRYNYIVDLPNLPKAKFTKKLEICLWIELHKDTVLPFLTQ